eukprot:2593233-Heterocapsa_arctica.AAC.1
MDVKQVILSVGKLHKKGHEVVFGPSCYLRAGREKVPLVRDGSLTYVEAMVLPDNASVAPLGEQQKWCLLEWAALSSSRVVCPQRPPC